MRILLTGGSGFIVILALFSKCWFQIVVIDSLLNSSQKVFDKINEITKNEKGSLIFKKGDIETKNLLDVFKEFDLLSDPIELVIHFAGLKSVSESVQNPLYIGMNVKGSLNLFLIMEQFNCFNLV